MRGRIVEASLYVMFWLVRALVALRYRLVVKGFEKIGDGKGILFLPNHPAEIDPVIIMMVLWRKYRPRPLVIEHFYQLPGVRFFMNLVKVLALPTMDNKASHWRAKQVQKVFGQVSEGLKGGENFLIYPSGKLKMTEKEVIGGASFVHGLVQECPEAKVVLIRTSGMWGSIFSREPTGVSPPVGATFMQAFKILLKNGIFFAPRRRVNIEIDLAPADFPRKSARLEFNRYLERWYNQVADDVVHVPYYFWDPRSFPKPVEEEKSHRPIPEKKEVPREVQRACYEQIGALSGYPVGGIKPEQHLSQDLGLDSLDVSQLYAFLDQKFDIVDLPAGELHTVEDFLEAAAGYKEYERIRSIGSGEKSLWPEVEYPDVEIPEGETISEVFLRICKKMGNRPACGDALSGILTYRRLEIGALILSRQIRKMRGEYVGVLLPSSVAAYMTILATMLAGKVPVMLNWTAGVRALDHAVDITHLESVITSERFLDKLDNGDLGKSEESFVFLENMREEVSFADKLWGWILSHQSPESILKRLRTRSGDDTAVLLFTSGTETLPKGVPLTHKNILSNQRAALDAIPLIGSDILYGVLPPFHSFGFTVTGLMPILCGVRVYYSPDPNDTHRMADEIAATRPTLFCCAPSFLNTLFRLAKPEQLQSLRYIVSGAEKAPEELFTYVKNHLKRAMMLEGYGITECSPVVTFGRVGQPHRGVGAPLKGISILTFNPETKEPAPEGEVAIHGPNVFKGYLGSDRNPFIEIGGKKWYRSGDWGKLDEHGNLILGGRLKRFVKIGGEMISLSGIEEEILSLAREKGWISIGADGPPLAVSVREKDVEKPLIILYTTFDVSRDQVNHALKERGLSRLAKISEVKQLGEIPLTGTGKTHYRLLDEQHA